MKKVLVTLVLVMTLGVSVSFAQAAPVEVPVVEKPQQSKKLVFSENLLGLSTETVCRAFTDLRERGAISLEGPRNVTIIRP